jgi:Neutral/alkaline non-lysosomal ceramidase, N-terminal
MKTDDTRMFTRAQALKTIRGIIVPALRKALDRSAVENRADGWVDMKFDPRTGEDLYRTSALYANDRIYSWIQGRSLETFANYLKWLQRNSGHPLLDSKKIVECGDRLFGKLYPEFLAAVENGKSLPFSFSLSDGIAFTRGNGVPSVSDMFVARGLLSYASRRGWKKQVESLIEPVRALTDSAINGRIVNDQIACGSDAGPGNEKTEESEIRAIEGPMLAVCAAEILYQASGSDEDLGRGLKALSRVFSFHGWTDSQGVLLILDKVAPDGSPVTDSGRLVTNPGHMLEIAGMGLQFLRMADELKLSDSDRDVVRTLREQLIQMAVTYDRLGRAPHHGIYRTIYTDTAEPCDAVCPWWSSFEAVRTFAEASNACPDEDTARHYENIAGEYLEAAVRLYITPACEGIPVQTVDAEGRFLPIIPATPDIDPGFHTGLPLLDAYELLGRESALLCGFSSQQIALEPGKPLQGHIARTGLAEGFLDPLSVKVFYTAGSRGQLLLLSADILEWSDSWASELTEVLSSGFTIHESDIWLTATHTHTGPAVIDLGLQQADPGVLAELVRASLMAAARAISAAVPARVQVDSAHCPGIGIGRRFFDPEQKKIVMRPNPEAPVDESLTTVRISDSDNRTIGLVLQAAVHPTSLGVAVHHYSGDIPGCTVRKLEEKLGGAVPVLFLQGACGDVRPALLTGDGRHFRDGSYEDCENLGAALAEAALQTLRRLTGGSAGVPGTLVSEKIPLRISLSVPSKDEVLRLYREKKELLDAHVPEGSDFSRTHEPVELMARADIEWARNLLDAYDEQGVYTGSDTVEAVVSMALINTSTVLVGLPGEAFTEIGMRIKEILSPLEAVIIGYCGGTIGYIPAESAFAEGGYEVDGAYRFYGLPGMISAGTEQQIYDTVRQLRERINARL